MIDTAAEIIGWSIAIPCIVVLFYMLIVGFISIFIPQKKTGNYLRTYNQDNETNRILREQRDIIEKDRAERWRRDAYNDTKFGD